MPTEVALAEKSSTIFHELEHESDFLLNISTEQKPFFLYSLPHLKMNLDQLSKYLSHLHKKVTTLHFSVKTNPQPEIIDFLFREGIHFDVSSFKELQFLKKIGVPSHCITFSGPGKSNQALELSLKENIAAVHVDSIQEQTKIFELQNQNSSTKICLRLKSPDIFARKLGLDRSDIEEVLQKYPDRISGIHFYFGRESFEVQNYELTFMQLLEFQKKYSHLEFYIGPGFRFTDDWPNMPKPQMPLPSAHLELGRALVTPAAVYGAPILSVKTTDFSKNVVIIEGGLQHLGSPFNPQKNGSTAINALAVRDGKWIQSSETIETYIYGSLCLWHDCLAAKLLLPANVKRGDMLVFPNCGAYGLTASVPHFIGQQLPEEYILDLNNNIRKITKMQFKSYHDCFDFASI